MKSKKYLIISLIFVLCCLSTLPVLAQGNILESLK